MKRILFSLLAVGILLLLSLKYYKSDMINNNNMSVDEKPLPIQDDTIEARIGIQAKGKSGIVITSKEVIEDSRCPEGFDCYHAGTVIIKASVSFNNNATEYTFELNKKVQTSYGNVTLTGVQPSKKSEGKLMPDQYVFTFNVLRE